MACCQGDATCSYPESAESTAQPEPLFCKILFNVKLVVFWDVLSCGLIDSYRRIRDAWVLNHPGIDAGGTKYLWKADRYLPAYTVQHPGRQLSSYSMPLEPEIVTFEVWLEQRFHRNVMGTK